MNSFRRWLRKWFPTLVRRTLEGIGVIVQHLIWMCVILGGIHVLGFIAHGLKLFDAFPVKYVLQVVDLAIILLFAIAVLLELWKIARGH